MLSKAIFTVTIGNHGVAIALHYGKRIQEKLFVDNLNPELETQIKQLFAKGNHAPISILIDIADQNYKKKTYPQVSKLDLLKIVSRDLKKEFSSDPDVLKGYLVHKDKTTRKWDCLFVSASKSEEVNKWIDFLLQVPNKISGIYMLPLEACLLARTILDLESKDLEMAPKNNVTFFIIQNKASGIRQVVFEGNQIIFTRMVYYDFNSSSFAEEFEQDVLRANEYLKRIISGVKVEDVNIINILPNNVIKKLNSIQNKSLSFINYSPNQVSEKIGFSSSQSDTNDNFSDFLIAAAFANSKKKMLRFSLPKLALIEKFYAGLKSIFVFNFILAISCLMIWIYTFMAIKVSDKKIIGLMVDKNVSQERYDHSKKLILAGDDFVDINLEQLMDFGKVNEIVNRDNVDVNDFLGQLGFFKNHNTTINSISLALIDNNLSSIDNTKKLDQPRPIESNTKLSLKVMISGTIKIKSGDVEELLKGFDALNKESKSALSKYSVVYDDLSKDLNFNKKYYDFPVNLRVESK